MDPVGHRRQLLALPAALLLAPAAGAASSERSFELAASWRGPDPTDAHQVGLLRMPPDADRVQILWRQALPGRAHGLLALPERALVVTAARPGRWLMRLDAEGHVQRRHGLDDEPDGHRLDGHALLSRDGQLLFTPQTDRQGRAWLAARDPSTLAIVERWPLDGIEPHHLLLHPGGGIVIAMGGIRRSAEGRKVDLHRMESALLHVDERKGTALGRWTLSDRRLSLRHLAWAVDGAAGPVRLGIALQAEHDDVADRRAAPLLAWWDGHALHTGLAGAPHEGYAGDITPSVGGGWVLSAQLAGRALAWVPATPPLEATVAQLRQACALARSGDDASPAAWLAAAAGAARWHPQQPPRLLRWPEPMVLDNHWVPWPG